MSIYCSRTYIGRHRDIFDGDPGRVVAYPENDLTLLDDRWPEGQVDTAHIPHYCVPGHTDDDGCDADGDLPVGPWLRLNVGSAGAHADVLLDRDAAMSLVNDLNDWISLDHVGDVADGRHDDNRSDQ